VVSFDLETVRLFLHVLAATIWVGGQLVLAGLVPVLRRVGADAPRAAAQGFSRIAWPAFAVLILTGVWNVFAESDHDTGSYRVVLIVKLCFVALSGVAAFLHARAHTRRGLAVWGALTGVAALVALLLGVVLGSSGEGAESAAQ
jgi:putative copper export protein